MIISRTPLRISFFGGGTDYPQWYKKNGGQVLSTSINKYIYITCRELKPFFKHKIRASYSIVEECENINQIKHPSIKQVLKFLKISKNIELHYDGDLPGKSGLGSSSSFIVGLLNALYSYQGITPSKKKLLNDSLYIEQKKINEIVGSQDQVPAVYGGLNNIEFKRNGKIIIKPINIHKERMQYLEKHLMLFYTGILRSGSQVAKTYVNKVKKNEQFFNSIYEHTNEAIKILKKGNIDDIGYLLDKTWREKQKLSKRISNDKINYIYKKAIKAGAIGGKLSGAGGGGFILLYVPLNKQEKVSKSLAKFIKVPIKFEKNGSQIVFNQ
tara:strand:+ start:3489 stop:4466 length:978 start_codon:yes stop_codon:yes gene_type:complete